MKGKLSRVFLQFTPYYWTEFHWNPFLSFQRYVSMTAVVWLFLVAEINSFYLKSLFWVPPAHWLNILRLFILSFASASSLAEYYMFTTDVNCVKIGQQAWVVVAIVATEVLILVKFCRNLILKPPPSVNVFLFWLALFLLWLLYAVYHYLFPAIIKVFFRRRICLHQAKPKFKPKSLQ